ncbi:MAG: hypothetical protein U9O49_03815 [Candidatus Thermoplasmatota archaeon]|nr:hypothetical protein [Candidatus Thermoplasmatota archaeon]
MNNKTKLFAGILVFGSLWGFSECIIGPKISDAGLPSGVIMTGLFAMIFLTMSRMLYRERGMQIGMGLTAGALRLFNPFGGCHVCSALAIMAEGMIFELIWTYATDLDLKNLESLTMKTSLGIFTAYCVYVGGYMITQILTPLSYGKFYFENLLALTPQIFASGLLVALIGGITIPAVLSIRKIDLTIKDALYYPATLGISVLCWLIVVGNYLMLA